MKISNENYCPKFWALRSFAFKALKERQLSRFYARAVMKYKLVVSLVMKLKDSYGCPVRGKIFVETLSVKSKTCPVGAEY
jgi:hypothetical protein